MFDDENPFRAPEAEIGLAKAGAEGLGCWTDGKLLIMQKGAMLPDACVRCAGETEGYRLRRTLTWHPQFFYLLIFMNVLIYLAIALVVRHRAKVMVPLCPRHRRRRSRAVVIGWVGRLGGVGIIIGPTAAQRDGLAGVLFLVGLGVLLGSLCYGLAVGQVVRAKRIDAAHAWILNVAPEYLALLPFGDDPRWAR